MKQEYKELLLKDLSARLYYGVKVTTTNPAVELGVISGISIENKISVRTKHADIVFNCTEVKPYLRPMSSMTEEEISDLQKINSQFCFDTFDNFAYVGAADDGFCSVDEMSNILNYLNSHHFDYHGLIEKGLAIEVTEENNPYNITEE